jgi:DMSO/TMAO reductase YedYZ molybdopterin-dependent catalytic subunit
MRRPRPVHLFIALVVCAGLVAGGCGGTSTHLLESEKKLAGMYEACKTIVLIDGATRKTIKTDSLPALGTIEATAVLKRSNGMTHTDVWKGTPLGAVLDANAVARPFKELRIQAWDGYVGRVGFDIATKPDTMLAYQMDGKPIPREDGPVRLVVPSQDGFYWIRMITRIEVLR